MWVLPVRRENDEFPYAPALPASHEVVEEPVERLAPNRGRPWEIEPACRIDAIFNGRCPEYLERRREVVSEVFDDERVTAKGKMRPMLLGGPHWHDETRVTREMR